MRFVMIAALALWTCHASATTYFVAQDLGADANPGSAEKPFKTMARAAEMAQPGDSVVVQPGIYRERVTPARGGVAGKPIIYRAATPHSVIVRGSEIFRPDWKTTEDAGVFFGALDARLFGERNPYRMAINIAGGKPIVTARPSTEARLPLTIGQVFVDGQPLTQVQSLAEVRRFAGTWMVDATGDGLLVHFTGAPQKHQVEIAVRDRIFAPRRRGLNHIHVEGFVFEHCANQGPFPQAGAVSVRSGHHWLIANNIVRWAGTIGIDFGSETWSPADLYDVDEADRRLMIGGQHVIKNNVVTDNGLCGIAGWNTGGVKIIGNVIERNNRLGFHAGLNANWEEQAGIKAHGFNNGLIEGNLLRDNNAYGIWLDNGWTNARVTRNVVLNNAGAGIFVELGEGPCLLDNNVIAGTRAFSDFYGGDGVYTHDASGVTVAHNLLLQNARFGVLMRTISERKVGPNLVETSRQRVLNNLMLDNMAGALNLPFSSERARDNAADYNVFSGGALAPHLFNANTNSGRVKADAIHEALRAALDKASIAPEARPNPNAKLPPLDLKSWQLLMNLDAHSAQPASKNRLTLQEGIPALHIKILDAAWKIGAPPVAGVDKDFFGQPLDAKDNWPGPFQGLADGDNRLVLWPVVVE